MYDARASRRKVGALRMPIVKIQQKALSRRLSPFSPVVPADWNGESLDESRVAPFSDPSAWRGLSGTGNELSGPQPVVPDGRASGLGEPQCRVGRAHARLGQAELAAHDVGA